MSGIVHNTVFDSSIGQWVPQSSGAGAMSGAATVSLPNDVTITGPTAQSAINTDLLTGTVNGWYDAAAFHSGAIQIIASAGISAGAITFEQTNSTSATGQSLPVCEPATIANSQLIGAQTIAASTARIFTFPVTCRYVRARISTAFVGGTVQAVGVFSELSYAATAVQALNPTAANLNVTASIAASQTLATVSSVTASNTGSTTLVADVASAALTTTTTTAAFTPTFGISYQVNIPVTAVSGTTPTLDVSIEESDDNGTNWFKVYDFPRITATGIYRSPTIPLTGTRVRYVQTVGGTTPSFTRAVNRVQSSANALPVRQLVDRSIVLTTLNSVTPTLLARDCGNSTQLVINVGAITTTAPAIQLEGSDDFGITWYAIGSPLTAVASSTVQVTVNSINAAAVRGRVSTAGVGVTAGYVMIKAHD
jgi:hypothetical protein